MFDTGEDNMIPFWGSKTKLVGGRDPLAIQNSSAIIYRNLIPGITNLTSRVRYMGFYCWLLNRLLKHLEQKGSKKLSKKEQISYLRRSELLLAYIMYVNYQSNNVTGVGGRQYVEKNYDIYCTEVNLKKGEKKYWKNTMGLFGQYYLSVMLNLGLLANTDDEHSWYRCTTIGDQLGDAFEEDITTEVADKFIESIVKGSVERKSLEFFKVFALHEIPDGKELNLYRKLILGQDTVSVPTYYRRQTIRLLLKFIEDGEKTDRYRIYNRFIVVVFLQENFEKVLCKNIEVSEEEKLWFLYEFNELVHYSFEVFHAVLLSYLSIEPQLFDSVINGLLDEVKEVCEDRGVEVVSDLDDGSSIHEVFINMRDAQFVSSGICYAVQLLYVLYKKLGIYLNDFKAQKIGTEQVKREGYAPILLPALIAQKEEKTISDVVKDILVKAINLHTKSSFEKSNVANGLVNNYIIDDGFIWKLRETVASRTNPRIKNTLQYLIDMRLVTATDDYLQLTKEGLNVLRKL